MARTLNEVVAGLGLLSGSASADPQDGHERWALYRQEVDAGHLSGLLLDAVALEPDASIALSLVLNVLEKVPEGDRPTWISRLAASSGRDYATMRAKEISIFEAAIAGDVTNDETAPVLDAWSDWLQLRLAGGCLDKTILGVLSVQGRTKRIRHLAAERMRSLRS